MKGTGEDGSTRDAHGYVALLLLPTLVDGFSFPGYNAMGFLAATTPTVPSIP